MQRSPLAWRRCPIPSQGNSTAGNVMISGLITLVVGTLQTKLQCGLASKSFNHLFHHLDTGALAGGMGLWISIINQRDSCLLARGPPFHPFIIPSRSGVLTGAVTMSDAGWRLGKEMLIPKRATSLLTSGVLAGAGERWGSGGVLPGSPGERRRRTSNPTKAS